MGATGPLMRLRAPLIKRAAEEHGLEPALVAAVVEQESGGFSRATRYERLYKWLFHPELSTFDQDQEIEDQKTSFGLMQVMGAVGREHGLPWSESCVLMLEAEVGLRYGCKHLAKQLARCDGDRKGALACYNGGYPTSPAGLRYANEVLNRVGRLKQDLFPST